MFRKIRISIAALFVLVLTFTSETIYGQCTYNSYTLSGQNTICQGATTTTNLTMSGSQSGVSYQLTFNNITKVGSPVSGTGAAITWSNVSLSQGNNFVVTATKSGCTSPTVVASLDVYSVPTIAASDVVITEDKTVLYPGDSIIFTITKSATASPQQTFTSYRLLQGPSIGSSTTDNHIVVKSLPNTYGYSISVASTCGSVTVPCPTFTVPPPLTAGTISIAGITTIPYNTAPGTLTMSGATGGTAPYHYQWQTSLDNIGWQNIVSANSLSYTPGNLLDTTYYRVLVSDSYGNTYSNTVTINVLQQPIQTSVDHNYISSWTATAPITDPTTFPSKPLTDVKLTVQYFDGLGRLLQTVAKQGSLITSTGASADLVTPIAYDAFGREVAKYLPYVASSGDGSYKPTALTDQPAWYGSTASPVAGQGELGKNATDSIFYEASPLNRVLNTMAPGNSWKGSGLGVQQGYWVNTAADSVQIWNVRLVTTPGSGFSTYSDSGAYQPGTLYKNITTDEAGHQIIEFKDMDGHVVLKKVQTGTVTDNGSGSGYFGWICTYYIYSDLGNLNCVIQPEGVRAAQANNWSLTPTVLSQQCFRYDYDQRNRMIMKQVPGAGAVYMCYDNRDRLVIAQDSNMRANNNWIATWYDNFNRPDTTWQYNTTTAFTTLLTSAAATSPYPTTAPTTGILTQTHYDDYTGLPSGLSASYLSTWNSYFSATSTTTFPYPVMPAQNTEITTKGSVTWSQAKVLDSSLYLATVNIYDDKGRLIQTQSENITGGTDVTTTQYSWAGWPLVTVQKQEEKKGSTTQTTVIVTKMTYDNLGRLVKTEMQQSNSKVNGGAMSAPATISEIQYDALGQVKEKLLGRQRTNATTYSSNPLETQGFDYNIRGWLLGVNRTYAKDVSSTDTTNTATQADGGEIFIQSIQGVNTVVYPATHYFGFDLGYDKINGVLINNLGYDTARYDGNIAGMVWKNAYDTKVRKYDFGYDAVNRLTTANFGQYTGHAFTNATVNYNVNNLSYDANGNIKTMNQYGLKSGGSSAVIDQLTYTYQANSNKLAKVADAAATDSTEHLGDFQDGTNSGDDYAYDGNGNMISDQNKKISSITYNYLNLPSVIRVSGKGSIYYTYDAAGNKLKKTTVDSTVLPAKITTTLYIGNSVYQNDTLQFFGTSEGRARPVGNAFVYDYFLKDQLGNTRMVITDDYNVPSPILEANSYYPFGLQQKGISLTQTGSLHNYKNTFQKQEFNGDLGVDVYEFKYRMDDPQIGRFWQVDPLADDYTYNSPYAFSENRVINGVELEGLEFIEFMLADEAAIPKPFVEATSKTEWFTKNASRGRMTEAQQLANNGLEKNTKPIEVVDPKTGKVGRTIPDALKNNGQSTSEVKDVKSQSRTKQLRLQEAASNKNGFKPELIINEGAKVSKPVEKAFDIIRYTPTVDATGHAPVLDPSKIKPPPPPPPPKPKFPPQTA